MAFRRWIPNTQKWRGQVLASLYDAQMFACRGLNLEALKDHRHTIISNFKQLFNNEVFSKSITAATNNIGNFRTRVTDIRNMLLSVMQGN
jgi:hypothetical protein